MNSLLMDAIELCFLVGVLAWIGQLTGRVNALKREMTYLRGRVDSLVPARPSEKRLPPVYDVDEN